ncbi:MAG: hypothetical protein LDLANPLL_00747 [Turneriella sp.]|nr:hypothetical protein [Turneriella sp.]
MSTLISNYKLTKISFQNDTMNIFLDNGRILNVPLKGFPRLLNAAPKQRNNYRLSGAGTGIHWPDIDEDLNLEWLVEDYG